MKDLEKNFFISGIGDNPPVQGIGYWEMEPNKKSKKQKKMFQSEIYDEYMDTFVFLANNTYYVIYLSGDINYQKDYTDLMTELIYSISIVKEKTN